MLRTRLKRIITIAFLLFVKILIFISVAAYSPSIQSFLASEVTKFLSKKFEIDIGIEKLYLKLPNKIILNNIYINDSIGNPLLTTNKIDITIASFKIFKSKLFIEEIRIVDPNINAVVDTEGNINYLYIFNKFTSNDKEKKDTTSSGGFDIFCDKLSLENAHFKYKDLTKTPNGEKFDLANLDVNGVNLAVCDFRYDSDTLELKILDFNFAEHSGISINQLSLYFKYFDTGIIIKDLILKTKYSEIVSSNIELQGKDSKYLSDPLNKLTARIELDTVIFDIIDLAPFLPEYNNIHDKIYLSGNFSGKLSNIKMKDFNIAYGRDTKFAANFSIDGLPDLELAFMFANISRLETSSRDLTKLLTTISPKKTIMLPKIVEDLNNISFTGNITGLLNDIVAYGQFDTGLGSIRTDLALVTDFDNKKMSASGKLRATDVELGKIIGDETTFGVVSLSASLSGKIDSLRNYNADINCDISQLGLLGYNYTGIVVNGLVSNDNFDGELYIDDPNLQVEFLGKYKYNNQKHNNELNFSADIWANLSNLNLLNDTLQSEVKLVLYSDLRGDFNNIPQGNLNISELKFNLKEKEIKMQQFNLNSYLENVDQQYITLRSDYCDLNLYGNFKFEELFNIFGSMAHNYVPAFVDYVEPDFLSSPNTADFDIKIKNINPIISSFVPKMRIRDDLLIKGNINGKSSTFNTIISIPVISYDSIFAWGSSLHIDGFKDSVDIKFSTQEISTRTFPILEDLNIDLGVNDNNTLLNINWDNHDTVQNSGNIKIATKIIKNEDFPIPKIENHIYPSYFTIFNRKWELSESDLNVNPNDMKITVNNFSLNYQNQSIDISGEVSQDKTKLLRLAINNVDISNINPYINSSGYQVYGILSGNARASDLYNLPSFRGSISINDFKVNNEEFGRFDLSALWNGETKGFNVEGSNRYLKLKGIYTPENDNIDINLMVDNFKLEVLEPYLNDFDLSNLKGTVEINLSVLGNAKDPDISGYINFDKAELTYDFLKLRALLNDRVEITKNAILFNNFKIADEYNNPGTINGGLYHNNFRDLRFDFYVDANKMKLLNTTEKDNSKYYGTAYATATARIAGNGDKFGIDVVAKTEPNTVFVLPMSSTYEAGGVSFLTFVNNVTDSSETRIIQPIKSTTDFYFKMDIEVTPDAEVQIVFDPKVGDLIRGYAKGNLKMEYTSDEEFYMYGEVEIVNGDYLFTLENIINKKLIVTPGGTITWSGDPLGAILDLEAVYQTRAPLKELMSEIGDSSEMYRSANVECKMDMTGNLMSPDIQFSIDIPSGSDKAKAQLANMSQDEINKQFIFLLVMNRFYATDQTPGSDMGNSGSGALGTTSFELLSNQVSNWLSQISKDFDIGFKYHPGTEVSGQEFEVALSTQILNDRVLINGNVEYGDNKRSNTNTMVGDIEVQLKVNPSGTFRVKGFSRINDEFETEYGPYTSGVGIFYTKDFDTFGEMMLDLWEKITFKNFRERRKQKKLNKNKIIE
ncbi:MAG: translocation/assembly module TamB [Bacteroidales bacterium]|nr:translocation/assembly module TamB [Bacteroidales bacterium]